MKVQKKAWSLADWMASLWDPQSGKRKVVQKGKHLVDMKVMMQAEMMAEWMEY